jgi:hypothetical protein
VCPNESRYWNCYGSNLFPQNRLSIAPWYYLTVSPDFFAIDFLTGLTGRAPAPARARNETIHSLKLQSWRISKVRVHTATGMGWPEQMKPGRVLRRDQERKLSAIRNPIPLREGNRNSRLRKKLT